MVKEDTPLMRQYTAAKAQHPDAIVFLRMGDFYEMWATMPLPVAKPCRSR